MGESRRDALEQQVERPGRPRQVLVERHAVHGMDDRRRADEGAREPAQESTLGGVRVHDLVAVLVDEPGERHQRLEILPRMRVAHERRHQHHADVVEPLEQLELRPLAHDEVDLIALLVEPAHRGQRVLVGAAPDQPGDDVQHADRLVRAAPALVADGVSSRHAGLTVRRWRASPRASNRPATPAARRRSRAASAPATGCTS